MSDVPLVRARLLHALGNVAACKKGADELTANLRQALIDFASETPDNLNCVERVSVGRTDSGFGLKLKGRDLLFSELAHSIESEPMPDALRDSMPELTEAEWDAFTRMTTLLYTLLSRSED